jgi:NADPH:quinone reductase-like Zn-dependent oxidoreductase
MKAAIVKDPGTGPVYGELPSPVGEGDAQRIRVTASAISHVARSRASGGHYSSNGQLPFVPGLDGTGQLDDGRRVYFFMPDAPNGSFAEETVVPASHLLPLPDDLDDVTAAALVIPGVSSWAALAWRAQLKPGETVLINGATGAAGRLAVQIAKHLGAGKVIAAGRNPEALAALPALGADATIQIESDADAFETAAKPHFAGGVDIVLDYLWGSSAERLLIAAARAGDDGRRIRYVEIGSASGQEITLPGAVLRSSSIELMGSGLGSIPPRQFVTSVRDLLAAAKPAGLAIATRTAPLSDIEREWTRGEDRSRTVVTMGAAI